MGRDVGPLERAVASALADYTGPVAVMCFNPNAIAEFGALAPDVARGLVTGSFRPEDWILQKAPVLEALRSIAEYDRVGAGFISHRFDDLDRPRVAELKAAGARVISWTIRSAEDEGDARRIADTVTFEGYAAGIPG
jgi:glycerophosphoryl diester phosphodiesterase